MDWNLDDMDLTQLDALLDAVDVVHVSRKVARRHSLDTLDDLEIGELQMRLAKEVAKRTTTSAIAHMMEVES